MAPNAVFPSEEAHDPIGKPEPILRGEGREIVLLAANGNLSLTCASRAAGERVTDPHIHRHTEAFYILEGELTFEVGPELEPVTIAAGGFIAVPPGVAHSYLTAGDEPARWLIIHARDGGFASFMRGIRDGVTVEWDIAPVPSDGGLPAHRALVRRPLSEPHHPKHRVCPRACDSPGTSRAPSGS